MSLLKGNSSLFTVFKGLKKYDQQTMKAMTSVALQRTLKTTTAKHLLAGAGIGVGATVGRNMIQGRGTFDGVGGGALTGAAGMFGYRFAGKLRQAPKLLNRFERRTAASFASYFAKPATKTGAEEAGRQAYIAAMAGAGS
jgi:hypothetical protein